MMPKPDTIEKSRAGVVRDYLIEAKRSEYYIGADGKPRDASIYLGKGAKALGIEGKAIDMKSFDALLEGFHPKTGARLTKNAGTPQRKTLAIDCVLTPPKSVDVAMAFASDETRAAIIEAHTRANAVAMAHMEAGLMIAVGAGGKLREQCAGVVVASVSHFAGREEERGSDPDIHSHNVIFCAAMRDNGTWASVDERDVRALQKETGSIYDAAIASELNALGFGIEASPKNDWAFKIAGISDADELEFSQRHEAIQKEMAAKGVEAGDYAGERKAWASTREAKHEPTAAELSAAWAIRGAPLGLNADKIESLRNGAKQDVAAAIDINAIAEALTENASTFTRKSVLCAVANAGARAGGLSPAQCQALTEKILGSVIDLGLHEIKSEKINAVRRHSKIPQAPKLRQLYTTTAAAVGEMKLARAFGAAQQDHQHDRAAEATEAAMARYEIEMAAKFKKPVKIKDEQKAMVRHLATCGRVGLVQGSAGVGKSFAAGAVRELEEASGQTVHALSLAAVAAQSLKSGASIEKGGTLHSFLAAVKSGKTTLTARDTIIVDEAAMVGAAQMLDMMTASESTGAKVILIGDAAQFSAIARGGGWFESIQKTSQHAVLVDIERQKIDWHLEAVHALRQGHGQAGLELFAANKCFSAHASERAALREMAAAYANDPEKFQEKLAMASTHKQAGIVNDAVRAMLLARGQLGPESYYTDFTSSDGNATYTREIRTGERLRFTKNAKLGREKISNGESATIQKISRSRADGDTELTLLHDDGRTIIVKMSAYSKFSYAYCSTAMGAQGATVDRAYTYIDERACQQNGYVGGSRSRQETKLYAAKIFDSKGNDITLKAMARALSADRSADWSLDYLSAEQREKILEIIQKEKEKNTPMLSATTAVKPITIKKEKDHEQNFGDIDAGTIPPPHLRNRLRHLSDGNMVFDSGRDDRALRKNVCGDVEHEQAGGRAPLLGAAGRVGTASPASGESTASEPRAGRVTHALVELRHAAEIAAQAARGIAAKEVADAARTAAKARVEAFEMADAKRKPETKTLLKPESTAVAAAKIAEKSNAPRRGRKM